MTVSLHLKDLLLVITYSSGFLHSISEMPSNCSVYIHSHLDVSTTREKKENIMLSVTVPDKLDPVPVSGIVGLFILFSSLGKSFI